MPRKRPLTPAQIQGRNRDRHLQSMMRGVPKPQPRGKLKSGYNTEDLGNGMWGHWINVNRIGIPIEGVEVAGPVYAVSRGEHLKDALHPNAPDPFFACGGSVDRMVFGRRAARVEVLANLLERLGEALPVLATKWNRNAEEDLGELWFEIQAARAYMHKASARPGEPGFPEPRPVEEMKILEPTPDIVVASKPPPVIESSAEGI